MSATALAQFEADAKAAANLKHGKRLSVMDRALIIKARRKSPPASVAEIASVIGCDESTVYRCLASMELDVVPVLASYADEAVEHLRTAAEVAASKGYQQPALALLHYGQKLEPLADPSKHGPNLAIQVNLALSPGTPSYAPPQPLALDAPQLTIETHALNADTSDVTR